MGVEGLRVFLEAHRAHLIGKFFSYTYRDAYKNKFKSLLIIRYSKQLMPVVGNTSENQVGQDCRYEKNRTIILTHAEPF